MAVTYGTISSVHHIEADGLSPLQQAVVYFTMSGTYAQADNGQVSDVDAAIEASLRNGKQVTLVDAVLVQPARKDSNKALMMGAKTVAVSGANITFEATEGATAHSYDGSTELANGAWPAHDSVNFGLLVTFTAA
jgi:hypothetical protein